MKRILGNLGEEKAASYLADKGFNILCRNWRFGHLEIDIICLHEDTLVFVEVKTRRTESHGGAPFAITPRKMRNLSKAAEAWLSQKGDWFRPCRFDVVCLSGYPGSFSLQHYPNAFPYVSSLDSFNAYR